MLNTSADYRANVYNPVRKFKARATIDLLGAVNVYDDNTIMRMKILDEMSTINETLPSNELELTMDNSGGQFDLLTLSNMHQILASKPTIQTEIGLSLGEFQETEIVSNYIGKLAGNTAPNSNYVYYSGADALTNATSFSAEVSQAFYDGITTLNGSTGSASTTIANNRRQVLFAFNVIEMLEKQFGTRIWLGKTSLADKVALAKSYMKSWTFNWHGRGSGAVNGVNTDQISISVWSGSSWGTTKTHTKNTVSLLTIPSTSTLFIRSDGYIYFNAYAPLSDGVIASWVRTDYVEFIFKTIAFEAIEWMPSGKFFLTEWKNEVTDKIVTLIGNDYFDLLADISYESVGITNLKDLAIDVLTKGGVPVENQQIDDSLAAITVNPFPERLNMRSALQYIGIAGMAAVSQDRLGNVYIKPFRSIDEASNYITYTTSQTNLYGYASLGVYPLNDTGGGMKYLDFDNMYSPTKVSLEKSIYQLIIKVYGPGEPIERLYVNDFIGGTNGLSFIIANPLINTNELADKVADWYIREINYNAIYNVDWRQNPALECGDMILVEDSFNAEKQTRIIKQQLDYRGYLEGITESRGGV